MDIGDLLQLECPFKGHGVVDASPQKKSMVLVGEAF